MACLAQAAVEVFSKTMHRATNFPETSPATKPDIPGNALKFTTAFRSRSRDSNPTISSQVAAISAYQNDRMHGKILSCENRFGDNVQIADPITNELGLGVTYIDGRTTFNGRIPTGFGHPHPNRASVTSVSVGHFLFPRW